MVFVDDEAVLWLRRGGACDSLARAYAYHYLPGGPAGIGPLGELASRDSTARAPISAEIERAIAQSPYNARSQAFAGNLAFLEDRFGDARAHFDEAARQQPFETEVIARQGLAHLFTGDLDGAARAFRAARAAPGKWPEADLREGQLLAARGDRAGARRAYERSLARYPQLTDARDSLEAMGAR
jgi:tetratricopeptide (TPR) repeat protein